MEWLNIHSSTVDSEVMQDAEKADCGVWLFLSRYCAGQENGGRIKAAKAWTDKKWMKCAGVSKEEVLRECGLWSWEEEDLVLEFYPHDQERAMAAKRRGGKKGARIRHSRVGMLIGKPEGVSEGETQTETQGEVMGQLVRNGREGKERKGNGMEVHALSGISGGGSEGFAEVPSEKEVRAWANGAVGVDPEYAAEQWHKHEEDHRWIVQGRVIDWRGRFKRYWEADRAKWAKKFKNPPGGGATVPHARDGNTTVTGSSTWNGRQQPGDQAWWWTEDFETLEKALDGALALQDAVMVARIKEVLRVRRAPR